jgi:beta-phosphoglucomutase-like phosphatase (HAD superfamily)
MNKQFVISVLLVFFAVLLIPLNNTKAQDGHFRYHTKIFDNLTTEQRQAINEKIKELSNKSASREEIHDAVVEMLEEYGVDVPDDFKMMPFPGPYPLIGWIYSELTEEQKADIQAEMDRLDEEGASPLEMRNALRQKLESYGVDMMEKPFWVDRERGFGRRGFMADSSLSDEQRAAIREKIKEMREQGKDPKEIHDEIGKMFESYGIEQSERHRNFPGRRHSGYDLQRLMQNPKLSEQQKEAIKSKVNELHKLDRKRKNIHKDIDSMLVEYGVEPSPYFHKFARKSRFDGGIWGFLSSLDLTQDQRKAIRSKVKELHKKDADPKEIHKEINSMLQEYGIEIPAEVQEHQKMMESLTKEQCEAVREKIRKMHRSGADQEKIRQEVKKMVEDFNKSGTDKNDK